MTNLVFRFGSRRHGRIGTIKRIPISSNYFMSFIADVFDIDIPLLIGLDVLTRSWLIADLEDNRIISKREQWTIPHIRKRGHAYIEWTLTIFYTEAELRRVHRHFLSPTSWEAILRSKEGWSRSRFNLVSDLEKISFTCDFWHWEGDAPHRFGVSLPKEDCV